MFETKELAADVGVEVDADSAGVEPVPVLPVAVEPVPVAVVPVPVEEAAEPETLVAVADAVPLMVAVELKVTGILLNPVPDTMPVTAVTVAVEEKKLSVAEHF